MTRAFGYVRVSTEEQAKEGYSLPAQRRRIAAYCEAQGWDLRDIYEDAGISGFDTSRPAYQQMLSDLESHYVQKVVFVKIDRLGRNALELLSLRDKLESLEVGLVSIEEAFDSSTATGRLFWGMLALFAQFFRDQVSERTKQGLAEARRQGVRLGRPPKVKV